MAQSAAVRRHPTSVPSTRYGGLHLLVVGSCGGSAETGRSDGTTAPFEPPSSVGSHCCGEEDTETMVPEVLCPARGRRAAAAAAAVGTVQPLQLSSWCSGHVGITMEVSSRASSTTRSTAAWRTLLVFGEGRLFFPIFFDMFFCCSFRKEH